MSINNPEQQHSTNPDVAQSTAELKALHALPAETPPEEHRDDKDEKARKRARRKKMGYIAGAAMSIPPLVATAAFMLGLEKADNKTEPQTNPGNSAPANPGAGETANTPEVEVGGGVTLTPEQLEALNSGDEAAIAEVMNETLVNPLDDRMEAYSAGESDVFDISDLVSEPQVQEDILNTITSHWPDFDEQRAAQAQRVGFCNANIPNPDSVGSRCEDRFSVFQVGQPLTLDGVRIVYDLETFGEVPEDWDNLAETRPEFNFDSLYVSLDGDKLSIAKR